MKKPRRKKGLIVALIVLAMSLWSVISISLGVMLIRDEELFPSAIEKINELFESSAKYKVPDNALAQVNIIDVGQGSAALFQILGETPKNILIDAGEAYAADEVLSALNNFGVSKLDIIIITHPHTDHFGGCIEVLKNYNVNELWLPHISEELTPTNVTYLNFLEALSQNSCNVLMKSKPEKVFLSDFASLSLLNGFAENPDSLNDASLCVRLDIDAASFLITGDGEKAVEDALLENERQLNADILIAGHHGSNTSSSQQFLNAVSPTASIVSVGRDNDYNLPNQNALKRLSNFGNIYRTDINGSVFAYTDGKSITVTAQNVNDTINVGR